MKTKFLKFIILGIWVASVSSCNDFRINHCIYGVSDNIVKIEAEICGEKIVPYKKMANHWEPEKIIVANCESDIVTRFYYESGETVTHNPFYMSWPQTKSTDYDLYYTREPSRFHRQKATSSIWIKTCLKQEDLVFTSDFTRGETCNKTYYSCEE